MSFTNKTYIKDNQNDKIMTDYNNYYNTFNSANTNFFSVRDKMENKHINQNKKNKNIRLNRNTFLNSSAPFYICNNDKNGMLVRYNGGPQKKIYPRYNNTNLSRFLPNRSTSLRFKRPCGCLSNYNISKYTQFWDYPYYNNNYRKNNLPFLNRENMRYSHRIMTPQYRNNTKITYKLKNNDDNDNFVGNGNVGEYNDKIEENENEKKNDVKNQLDNEEKEEKKEEIKEEKKNNVLNYFKKQTRRRFHKVQIFNNYKPFLVDDFKDYADYE